MNRHNLSFVGVNVPHQNGFVERRIREFQDPAKTMMVYENKRCPKSISTNLWPYAICMGNEILNNTLWLQHKNAMITMEKSSKLDVPINQKNVWLTGVRLSSILQQNNPHGK